MTAATLVDLFCLGYLKAIEDGKFAYCFANLVVCGIIDYHNCYIGRVLWGEDVFVHERESCYP